MASASRSKTLYIVRHGQALHNPRAEVAKANGCSMDEFLDWMRQDDALDADLTDLGRDQAKSVSTVRDLTIDLVVSSPLSRALETADLVYPPKTTGTATTKRVSMEDFREVNGNLLNGKRRSRVYLQERFKHWNFENLQSDEDDLWTIDMEDFDATAERGYRGLSWLLQQQQHERILLVSHGGILRYLMNRHDFIQLQDRRTTSDNNDKKDINARFENCEVRKYLLSWKEEEGEDDDDDNEETSETECATNNPNRRTIILTQIDH
jgi:broad specificity phosphatase PhoE